MLTRRQVELPDGPGKEKVEQKIVDFDKLDESKDAFADADLAFCCLGTTRAKAGKEGFIKVDYDYVVNSAKILKENGKCTDFHLVSSWGKLICLSKFDENCQFKSKLYYIGERLLFLYIG